MSRSSDTSMEIDEEVYYSSSISNSTDAIIYGTGTCYSSDGSLSLISDPNITSSSSTSVDDHHHCQQQLSTAAAGNGSTGHGDDDADDLSIVSSSSSSGASSSKYKEVRIFNVDFRALCDSISNKVVEGCFAAGSYPKIPGLPWVSTTGPGPNSRTISGITYRYTATQIRIVCACHGAHMSSEEFVRHAS